MHTGITSGCITCHGAPNTNPPVFYLNYTPKDAKLTPVHIPSGATLCENCHASNVFTAFSGTTMTAGKHTLMFTFIGGTCDQCHELTTPKLAFYGVNNLTVRPGANHYAGRDCNGCHSTNSWAGGAAKRKAATAPTTTRTTVGTVVTSAATAQGRGRLVGGRGALGLAAAAALAQSGTAALGAAPLSHAGIANNCFSCHNGVLATGKAPTHIASNNLCENCHTTMAWIPARFDHQGVAAKCVSCHNGAAAPGKPTRHIQTGQDCGVCHGTIAWQPVTFSHIGISTTCQSCHNSITATGKQLGHAITMLDCSSCHNTMNWTITASAVPLKPLIQRPGPRGPTIGPKK